LKDWNRNKDEDADANEEKDVVDYVLAGLFSGFSSFN